MRRIIFILLSFVLLGCGKDEAPQKETPVEQSPKYPENLVGTVWGSKFTNSFDGGTEKFELHFFNDTFKFVLLLDHSILSRVEFKDRGSYYYSKGKGFLNGRFSVLNSVFYANNGQRFDFSTLSPSEQLEFLNKLGIDGIISMRNFEIKAKDENTLLINDGEFVIK